jgi:hypothetical protein
MAFGGGTYGGVPSRLLGYPTFFQNHIKTSTRIRFRRLIFSRFNRISHSLQECFFQIPAIDLFRTNRPRYATARTAPLNASQLGAVLDDYYPMATLGYKKRFCILGKAQLLRLRWNPVKSIVRFPITWLIITTVYHNAIGQCWKKIKG